MKKRIRIELVFTGGLILLLSIGCRTVREARPVSWESQSAYLAQLRDPRVYGFGIYPDGEGVVYRGGTRLRPRQAEALPMVVKNPYRPLVKARSGMSEQWPLLLDITSRATWINFTAARHMGAVPVGEQDPVLVRREGDVAAAALSVVPALRLGQVQIESPLVYVRFADGHAGAAARGIERPTVEGAIGWDLLRGFEQIRFDYRGGNLLLFTEQVYEPHPDRLVAELPLVDWPVCAVDAEVDGVSRMVLIDPAGDFEVAVEPGDAVHTVRLGGSLEFSGFEPSVSPGGLRIGARLLQSYSLILAPRRGMLYLERQ